MLTFQEDFSLKTITTLGIGGPAKQFIAVKTPEDLKEALSFAKTNNLESLFIGGGSNLLVSDEGVEKVVIKNEIKGITQEGMTLKVKSGTPLQELVNYSIEHNLAGLQKLTGIPGTVGGAVFGNAGAYGQSISDHLTQVQTLSSEGEKSFSKNQCEFEYRSSIFKKNHFPILEIIFTLTEGGRETMKKEAQETLKQREIKYPSGIRCPGSFFKNLVVTELTKEVLDKIPEEKIVYGKVPAGALLEEIGARGMEKGAIEIAPYHANLFINRGNGTAKDFYELAKDVALKVKERFGISLEPEVQLINLPPSGE